MNSELRWYIVVSGISLSLLATLCGCGGGGDGELPRAAVQGSVSLNGHPLEEGVVRFVPAQGTSGPKTTVPVESGQFEMPAHLGPVVGSHRIEIESTDDGGYALDDEQALARLRAERKTRILVVRVPSIYNSRSRLTAEVVRDGPNEYDFTLTSKPHRTR